MLVVASDAEVDMISIEKTLSAGLGQVFHLLMIASLPGAIIVFTCCGADTKGRGRLLIDNVNLEAQE